MRIKFLMFTIVALLIAKPAYSVTEAEFYKMQEQLQNALMKINAMEQSMKQSKGEKSGVVKTKAKKGLTINTSGGGIKLNQVTKNLQLADV